MDPGDYAGMDPAILYSLLNMRLRNDYRDLDDLSRAHDLDREGLQRHMAVAGFVYDPAIRQFRATGSGPTSHSNSIAR